MPKTKEFSLGVILSVMTGKLLVDDGLSSISQLVEFMCDREIPDIVGIAIGARHCAKDLCEQFGDLAVLVPTYPTGQWREWLEDKKNLHGSSREVQMLSMSNYGMFEEEFNAMTESDKIVKRAGIMKIGICIMRVQVDDLHLGHKMLLRKIASVSDEMIIFLGVARSLPNKRNPLDYPTREAMVKSEGFNCTILPILDESSDLTWSRKLDEMIRTACPRGDVTLYTGRDGFDSHYQGQHSVVVFTPEELNVPKDLTSTEYRNQIRRSNTLEFRRGVIYSINGKRDQLYQTVDMALVSPTEGVLLGRKPGEDKWRFPGGFVDPSDNSLESAAARELNEEAGVRIDPKYMKYLGSCKINDWRYREGDTIMTAFFRARVEDCQPSKMAAGDDLAEIQWFKDPQPFNMVPAHQGLLERFGKELMTKEMTSV